MSNSKLFSDPVISTSDVFSNQDNPTDNMDFDPNKESLYDRNQSTGDEPTQPNTTTVNSKATLKDDDIFTEEPLEKERKLNKGQINNDVADTINQTYTRATVNEYEDEPSEEATTRKWIIGGLIGVIVLLCLGWFGFSMIISRNSTPTAPAQTTIDQENTQTQQPQKTPDSNTTDNASDQSSNNQATGTGNTSGGSSSGGSGTNGGNSPGYSNGSSQNNSYGYESDTPSQGDSSYNDSDDSYYNESEEPVYDDYSDSDTSETDSENSSDYDDYSDNSTDSSYDYDESTGTRDSIPDSGDFYRESDVESAPVETRSNSESLESENATSLDNDSYSTSDESNE